MVVDQQDLHVAASPFRSKAASYATLLPRRHPAKGGSSDGKSMRWIVDAVGGLA
jgi:hypothetical protein